jgi:hypothetical protein
MKRRTTPLVLGAVAVAIVALVAVGIAIRPTSQPPKVSAPAPACPPLPVAATTAISTGGTWQGAGACFSGNIDITQANTNLSGFTLDDYVSTAPIKPIIEVENTSNVTLSDITVNGANTGGGYHQALVGGAGFDVRSVAGLTLTNDSTNDTYGDGLTLFFSDQNHRQPDTNVTVNGLTITSAGRQGITPGDVAGTGNTFTNVDIVSSADDSIDFESDLKNVGDGTLTFTNLQSQKLINIIEPYAELTFANASAGRMVMGGNAADTVSYSGSFTCTRRAPIGACVLVTGGTLDLNATFSRIPGTNTPTTPYTLAKLPGVIVGAP